ncbi:unnamed protein product, partial [Cyprideis torosa]
MLTPITAILVFCCVSAQVFKEDNQSHQESKNLVDVESGENGGSGVIAVPIFRVVKESSIDDRQVSPEWTKEKLLNHFWQRYQRQRLKNLAATVQNSQTPVSGSEENPVEEILTEVETTLINLDKEIDALSHLVNRDEVSQENPTFQQVTKFISSKAEESSGGHSSKEELGEKDHETFVLESPKRFILPEKDTSEKDDGIQAASHGYKRVADESPAYGHPQGTLAPEYTQHGVSNLNDHRFSLLKDKSGEGFPSYGESQQAFVVPFRQVQTKFKPPPHQPLLKGEYMFEVSTSASDFGNPVVHHPQDPFIRGTTNVAQASYHEQHQNTYGTKSFYPFDPSSSSLIIIPPLMQPKPDQYFQGAPIHVPSVDSANEYVQMVFDPNVSVKKSSEDQKKYRDSLAKKYQSALKKYKESLKTHDIFTQDVLRQEYLHALWQYEEALLQKKVKNVLKPEKINTPAPVHPSIEGGGPPKLSSLHGFDNSPTSIEETTKDTE